MKAMIAASTLPPVGNDAFVVGKQPAAFFDLPRAGLDSVAELPGAVGL